MDDVRQAMAALRAAMVFLNQGTVVATQLSGHLMTKLPEKQLIAVL